MLWRGLLQGEQLAIKDNRFASLRYNMTIKVDGDTSFFLRVVDLERTEFSKFASGWISDGSLRNSFKCCTTA